MCGDSPFALETEEAVGVPARNVSINLMIVKETELEKVQPQKPSPKCNTDQETRLKSNTLVLNISFVFQTELTIVKNKQIWKDFITIVM